jgi:hypothetical protein
MIKYILLGTVGFLFVASFSLSITLFNDEPEYEPPLQEIPTVIVRITDKNNVIHSREGMLLDGVVTVELSGK